MGLHWAFLSKFDVGPDHIHAGLFARSPSGPDHGPETDIVDLVFILLPPHPSFPQAPLWKPGELRRTLGLRLSRSKVRFQCLYRSCLRSWLPVWALINISRLFNPRWIVCRMKLGFSCIAHIFVRGNFSQILYLYLWNSCDFRCFKSVQLAVDHLVLWKNWMLQIFFSFVARLPFWFPLSWRKKIRCAVFSLKKFHSCFGFVQISVNL